MKLSSLACLFFYTSTTFSQWVPLAQKVNGNADFDKFGTSIDMSSDGKIYIVGSPQNDNNGDNAGLVEVYELVNNQWTQKGNNIYGLYPNDKLGYATSINDAGDIIAVGSVNNNGLDVGSASVYKFNNNSWQMVGQTILPDTSDFMISDIDLNANGDVIAIGSSTRNSVVGGIKIYSLINLQWQKLGNEILGGGSTSGLGHSLKLNGNGNIIAIGASNEQTTIAAIHPHEFINGQWESMGEIIAPFGGPNVATDVAINGEGSIVAYGSAHLDGAFAAAYRYLGNVTWERIGLLIDIDNEYYGHEAKVALNKTGNILAIATPNTFNNSQSEEGLVAVYVNSFDKWIAKGNRITGGSSGMGIGITVATSVNADTICIATTHYGAQSLSQKGHIKTFQYNDCNLIFPDTYLTETLVQDTGINLNQDSIIQCSEARFYAGRLNLKQNPLISDLTGIENFKNVKEVDVSNTNITLFDPSNFSRLNYLNISNTPINQLTFPSNYLLDTIIANNLTLLDSIAINNTISLDKISITDNQNLRHLNIANGKNELFKHVSITNNPKLHCVLVDNETDSVTHNKWNIDNSTILSNTDCININIQKHSYTNLITIYPNPSNGIIRVNNPNTGNIQFKIIDLAGRLVKSGTIPIAEQINFSSSPKGSYFIIVEYQNAISTHKLIVQ